MIAGGAHAREHETGIVHTCMGTPLYRSSHTWRPQTAGVSLRCRWHRIRQPVVGQRLARAPAEPEGGGTLLESAEAPAEQLEENFVPVCKPEDLPKGYRLEAKAQGVDLLLLWYRNQIYAIEGRSPAAGAYSEGFISGKLTQEYEIECPDTKSLFSLKTGEITSWYPTNPVLRAITPKDTVRNLDVFPVKLTQDAILVDVTGAATTKFQSGSGKGGSDSSIDANNVFAIQPRVYVESSDPEETVTTGSGAKEKLDPYVLAITIFAFASVAVAGTAVAIYLESFVGLGIFWAILLAITGSYVYSYLSKEEG